MSDFEEEDAPQDAEPTLYDTLRTRWYVAAIGGAGVILCLVLALSGVGKTWLDRVIELVSGLQDEPATEQPAPQATVQSSPPPTDAPTATATAEPVDVTTESPVAEVGDGNCNAPCDPAAPNCLVGLSCLPVTAGSANYVCWNTAICTPVTATVTAGVTPGITGTPVTGCGNGVCDPGEHSYNCPADCGAPPPGAPTPTNQPVAFCGDGTCNGSETRCDCSSDCGAPLCNGTWFVASDTGIVCAPPVG